MTPTEKLAICNQWFENKTVLTATRNYRGTPLTRTGWISERPRECSGVWGYEGDSIAIYIDGQPFPSSLVIEQNKDKAKWELPI